MAISLERSEIEYVKKEKEVLFISGIDTNVGKTYATAALANTLAAKGYKVITQKFIQTGCRDVSEDIQKHRELMEMPMLKEDKEHLTCPVILSYPSSPHLASQIDNTPINLESISTATGKLLQKYDVVLLEGAGGLMVPVTADKNMKLGGYLTIDYIQEKQYPLILVTSGKLGSLNHTLLSIEACRNREIEIRAIIYNLYPNEDRIITESSLEYLNGTGIPVITL